jgi:hypothetical protein
MNIQIKHRFTGAVLFDCELPEEIAAQSAGKQLGYAIKEALKARANLAGAYLAGADLAGAYLADAYLADAYLARANLAGANLAGANLADAYLADAYLAGANLADANLAGAYLAGANLARANLADANLAGAYLAGANLAGARNVPDGTTQTDPPEPYVRGDSAERRAKRAEKFRQRNPDVPVIAGLDRQILQVIEAGQGSLNMSQWHTCETTHCRAGWAIHLAGEAGEKLEKAHGPHIAGRMIYIASTGRAPHFFATNERAMEDIRASAAEQ